MFTYKKILVPLDGSELAERALPPALQIAKATGAEVVLLRVVSPLFLSIDPLVYDQMTQQGEDEAMSYLRSLHADQIPSTLPVHLVTQTGPVAGLILQYAQEHDCTLIVMSSHGRSGASRWVYGSVADKVLRGACCNVLIIRAQVEEIPFVYRRILVPLDGSQLAERALEPALILAQTLPAELVLLRVVNPAHLAVETSTMKQQSDYLETHDLADTQGYIQQIHASVIGQVAKVQAEIVKGPTAETIIDYAAENLFDLIVMSSHGRSGVERWIYGSITEKVLRGANCATLVIRDSQTQEV
jgi:nucleotide-binding universal stress UspA family protein